MRSFYFHRLPLSPPDRSRLAKGVSRKKQSLITRVQLLFTRLFAQRQTRSDSNYWIKRDPIAMETGSRMLLLDSSRGMRREEISTPPLSSFPSRPEEGQERRQPFLLLLLLLLPLSSPWRVEYCNAVIFSTSSFAMMKFHDELRLRAPPPSDTR